MRAIVAALLVCLCVAPVGAVDYYDVVVRVNHAGDIVVALGDLNGRPLTPPVITALTFVAAWAKTGRPTAPVTIGATAVILPIPLLLPAVGFAIMSEGALSAVVRIGHVTVQADASPYTSSALLTLERAAPDAPWVVTLVTVQ